MIVMEGIACLRFCRRFISACNGARGPKQVPDLYSVVYRRNAPSRMRTVTPENQYQRLLESATPLARLPYSQQLQIKHATLERALRKIVNIIRHNKRGSATPAIEKSMEENQGLICPLVAMEPSPKTEGFRNKEELNINVGADGDPNTVGLIIGRGSSTLCVPCEGLLNTKPLHLRVTKTFRAFLEQSKFRRRSADAGRWGHSWSRVLIRSNEQGHVMLVPELTGRHITQEVIEEARNELLHFYCSDPQAPEAVQSLYLRVRYPSSRFHHSQHHLHGDTHIYEEVLGKKFRISPEAFFQLNTPGAEVLYSQVQDMVRACQPNTLLDVGCGTGTIGICMSPLVERVMGFDVVQQAVLDAEFNADINGVQNARFLKGSARALMKTYVMDEGVLSDNTMAVVNPSRNGLNWKAIQRLRCCEPIRHVVYISCKPHGNALLNFTDLIVAESERQPGQPFRAVRAVGVDMFPHTAHSELVLLFER